MSTPITADSILAPHGAMGDLEAAYKAACEQMAPFVAALAQPPIVHLCPFCGWHDVEIMEIDVGMFAGVCPECECIGPLAASTAAAAAAWNLAGMPALLLLKRCEDFIAGFEGDPMQEGVDTLLADLRVAATPRPTEETP